MLLERAITPNRKFQVVREFPGLFSFQQFKINGLHRCSLGWVVGGRSSVGVRLFGEALVHNVTYGTAENTVFIPLKIGCFHKTTLCKIAWGLNFWRVFLFSGVGAALWILLFTLKINSISKSKIQCAACAVGTKSMTKI